MAEIPLSNSHRQGSLQRLLSRFSRMRDTALGPLADRPLVPFTDINSMPDSKDIRRLKRRVRKARITAEKQGLSGGFDTKNSGPLVAQEPLLTQALPRRAQVHPAPATIRLPDAYVPTVRIIGAETAGDLVGTVAESAESDSSDFPQLSRIRERLAQSREREKHIAGWDVPQRRHRRKERHWLKRRHDVHVEAAPEQSKVVEIRRVQEEEAPPQLAEIIQLFPEKPIDRKPIQYDLKRGEAQCLYTLSTHEAIRLIDAELDTVEEKRQVRENMCRFTGQAANVKNHRGLHWFDESSARNMYLAILDHAAQESNAVATEPDQFKKITGHLANFIQRHRNESWAKAVSASEIKTMAVFLQQYFGNYYDKVFAGIAKGSVRKAFFTTFVEGYVSAGQIIRNLNLQDYRSVA